MLRAGRHHHQSPPPTSQQGLGGGPACPALPCPALPHSPCGRYVRGGAQSWAGRWGAQRNCGGQWEAGPDASHEGQVPWEPPQHPRGVSHSLCRWVNEGPARWTDLPTALGRNPLNTLPSWTLIRPLPSSAPGIPHASPTPRTTWGEGDTGPVAWRGERTGHKAEHLAGGIHG